MSKKCRRCGHQNGDEHFFCQHCGEALDDSARVLMHYEKLKKEASKSPRTVSRQDQDDDYIPIKRSQAKKSHNALWIAIICFVVAAGVAAYFLLPH